MKKNRSPLSSVRASNGTANMKLNMLELNPLHISSSLTCLSPSAKQPKEPFQRLKQLLKTNSSINFFNDRNNVKQKTVKKQY